MGKIKIMDRVVILSTLICLGMLLTPSVFAAENLQVTTYYPSPSGTYQNLNVADTLTVQTLSVNNFSSNTLTAIQNLGVGTFGVIGTTLSVGGLLSANGGLTVGNNFATTLTGILNANGGANVTDLTVSNDAEFVGALQADGGATIFSAIVMGGLDTDTLHASSDAAIDGAATITGIATLGSDLTVAGAETVTGLLTANGGLAVNGSLTLTDLTVTNTATVGNLLTVGKNGKAKALDVKGNLAMNSFYISGDAATPDIGMSFSNDGRAALNTPAVTAPDAGTGATIPVLDIQPSPVTSGVYAKDRILLRVGPDSDSAFDVAHTATNATARINGTLSVANSGVFGGGVKAAKGILIGATAAPAGTTLNQLEAGLPIPMHSMYGAMVFQCTTSGPTCALFIIVPCSGAVAIPPYASACQADHSAWYQLGGPWSGPAALPWTFQTATVNIMD